MMNHEKIRLETEWAEDTTVPQLQRPAVMMWALMQFNWLLEQSGLFFDDDTAMRVYNHGLLYCQLHVLAAYDALRERRPRWKVRPRLQNTWHAGVTNIILDKAVPLASLAACIHRP